MAYIYYNAKNLEIRFLFVFFFHVSDIYQNNVFSDK